MTATPKGSPFLNMLESEVRKILKTEGVLTADRLKAIEQGSKLLMIRHKITEGADDRNFFAK